MADLDEIDRRLIDLLRKDGRMPAATLARSLGVSRATVQNRIDRLISRGVLVGFTARLRSDVETVPVRALTMIVSRA
ncbi:Lrp/AsnC family transcriptional regulator, partial [Salmonella enterica]|uniref:Lrp/AsnC family transcriptional regulator n=1 Tax=Salmonella enterica TaxID=28901 RepID=UPI00329A6CF3